MNGQVVEGKIVVVLKPPIIDVPVRPGNLMRLTGDLTAIAKTDSGDDLRRQGMFAQVEGVEVHPKKARDESSWWARLTLHDTLSPNHERWLAMVLGDKVSPLAEHTRELFRQSGLAHLTAASGRNLVLLPALWFAILPKRLKKEPDGHELYSRMGIYGHCRWMRLDCACRGDADHHADLPAIS